MNLNLANTFQIFWGMCALALLQQCQGAKYSNSLDLDEAQMSTLLDELSLPQHRIIQQDNNKPKKPHPWYNLLEPKESSSGGGGGASDTGWAQIPLMYDDYDRYARPLSSPTRRRRIVVKMKRRRNSKKKDKPRQAKNFYFK